MVKHVKWYVNVGKWRPTREEWLKLTSSIAEDEIERINKFFYQDDSKASLIGRALIRKFVSHAINRPSNELVFCRTEYGRPEVCRTYRDQLGKCWPKVFDFNLSHSGDYCVLAGLWSDGGCPDTTVGVDVTKIVKKKSRAELDRFLQLMSRREFTKAEWDTVEMVEDERQKCINFTRLWCLKESFIKSIGLGLSFQLRRIQFEPVCRYNLSTSMLKNNIISSTKVLLDGKPAPDWYFLESALDDEHLLAVGYNTKSSSCLPQLNESPFVELSIESLIEGLSPLADSKEQHWIKFSSSCIK